MGICMKMQGKNVAHAAIADDLFLQRQFPQGSDWLGGEAVINKCNKCRLVQCWTDECETRPPDVSSFS